jgi:hypothetical protein
VSQRKDLHKENQIEEMSRLIYERKSREQRKSASRNSEERKMFWLKMICILLVEKNITQNLAQQMEIENLLQLKIRSSIFIMSWYKKQRNIRYYLIHCLFRKKIKEVGYSFSVLVSRE